MTSVARKRNVLNQHINKKKRKFSMPRMFDNSFMSLLLEGDYKLSAFQFLILSIACGAGLGLVYFFQLQHNLILAVGAGLFGISLPYCCVSAKAMINNRIKELTSQKIFIELLEAELSTTNSTQEAIKNIANGSKDRLTKELCRLCNDIIKDISVGSSFPEALTSAIDSIDNKELKMALNILKINHEVGSSKTIDGLKSISNSLDGHIEIVKELNHKVGGDLTEGTMFYLIVLFGPLAMNVFMSAYFTDFISTISGTLIVLVIIAMACVGQFLIGNTVTRTLKNI